MDEEKWEDARSLLDQMTSRSLNPVLIDFGGLAFYSCSFPLKEVPMKLPKNADSVDKLERDLGAVIHVDDFKLSLFFKKWVTKTNMRRLSCYQVFFNTWHRMYMCRVHRRKVESRMLSDVIKEWHSLASWAKFAKKKGRIVKRRCFKIWKQCHLDVDVISRGSKNTNTFLKKKMFKKWKRRRAIRESTRKRRSVLDLHNKLIMSNMFDIMAEKYLDNVRKLRTDYFAKKEMLERWKKAFTRSQNLSVKELKVSTEANLWTERKFLLSWRRKMRNQKKKREKRNTGRWKNFTKRLLCFYNCKFASSKASEKRVFSRMKATIGQKNMLTKSLAFNGWLQCVDTTRRKKAIRESSKRWLMYRMFGKWLITWHAVIDIRLMSTVRKTVVNAHLKQHFFGLWLQRASDVITERNRAASLMRKLLLKKRMFEMWHSYTELLTIRAEENYRRTLLTGTFAIFLQGTIGTSRNNEAKAKAFRERKLKQRYLKRLKFAVPEPTDIDLTQMITLLNSGDLRYSII